MGFVKRSGITALAGLVVLSACAAGFAQSNTTQRAPYRLRSQDIIRVKVYNEILINDQVPVLPDGKISVPFVGLVEGAGRTVDEIAAELVDKYRDKLNLKDPKVSVTLEVFAPLRASIQGAVFRPEQYEFKPGDSILTLISRGGGAVVEKAELRRAMLYKAGSREVIPIDAYSLLMKGDTSQNYELEDGDLLQIPTVQNRVIHVQGAVIQPGSFEYKEPMFLVDAISAAHGPVPIRAKMSEIIVMRAKAGAPGQFTWMKANYVNLITKRAQNENIELRPGDMVYVTNTKTPDTNQLNGIFNTIYFANQFLSGGFFGFKLFGG